MIHTLGYFVLAFAKLLSLVINLYTFVIAAAVIISWVNADPYNPIVQFLHRITAPAFRYARFLIPRALTRTGIDFSPLLVLFALILLETTLVNILFDLARRMIGQPW
jgi:YggT family protein